MALPVFPDPQPGLVLHLGAGDGDRLLAPGMPDRLLADGHRLGWLSRGALFMLDPARTHARLVVLDQSVDSVATSTERWVLAHEGGLEIFDPEAGRTGLIATDLVEDLASLRPGGSLAVLRTATGNRAVDLETGEELMLPDGARRSRTLVPWSDGAGLIWIDDDSLYRWTLARGVSVCGQLPDRVAEIVPGPGGAVLVTLVGGGCLVAGPGRQATVLAQEVLAPTASFDATGDRLLASVAEGVAVFQTRTGALDQLWPGETTPVGFAPEPVRLDERDGVLRGPDGAVLLSFLGLAGVALDVPLLAGPGGTVWDLSTGAPAWPVAPLAGGVTLIDDDRVVHLDDRDTTVYGADGGVIAAWRIPLFPEADAENLLQTVRTGGGEDAQDHDEVAEAAWLGDDVAVLTLDGEVGVFDTETGTLQQRTAVEGYEETDGWPGLLPHRRRGVWLRDGEGARLLPDGQVLPDPGEPVEALCPAGPDVIRARGERLERLGADGQTQWSVELGVHLLALGRHLFAACGEDLVLLDADTGRIRQRAVGVLGDAEGFAALSDGHLWAWGGVDGEPVVRCLDGATGAHRRRWSLPADGVVVVSGAAWAWSDDGMLVRLAR